MNQTARVVGDNRGVRNQAQPVGRLSLWKFLLRYPIFFLAFGPPILRSEGIDASKGVIDLWSFFQAGLLSFLAGRAIIRLATPQSIYIPRQIRSILKMAFFLDLLFVASAAYSPSHAVSAAYALLYLFTLICVAEFVVDVYRNPPDWVECLFHLRLIAFLLLCLVILVLPFKPGIVMEVTPGLGMRVFGGVVAPVQVICPMIAIISAYSLLHSLESRGKALLLFLVGLAGSLDFRSRGCELALLLSLSLVAIEWAKTSRRVTYAAISAFMASILLAGLVVSAVGGGRIWDSFNRGQDVSGIESASGRIEMWKFVFHYCATHPWGMGYVAGFRIVFRQYYSVVTGNVLSHLGTAHNTFIDILAGAGWLALGVYLLMLVKTIMLAWRFVKQKIRPDSPFDSASLHGIRCSLVLLIYCLAYGMTATEFSAPLRAGFYIIYILIAIILGISARMIVAARAQGSSG